MTSQLPRLDLARKRKQAGWRRETGAGAGAEGGGVGGYRPLEPVQAPIAPPYKTAIAREKERDRK